MSNVYELLRMKEYEIARVQKEIRALHLVAQILSEPDDVQALPPDGDFAAVPPPPNGNGASENFAEGDPFTQPGETLPESMPPKRSVLRNWFGLAVGE